jgi:hypothetical protein
MYCMFVCTLTLVDQLRWCSDPLQVAYVHYDTELKCLLSLLFVWAFTSATLGLLSVIFASEPHVLYMCSDIWCGGHLLSEASFIRPSL